MMVSHMSTLVLQNMFCQINLQSDDITAILEMYQFFAFVGSKVHLIYGL